MGGFIGREDISGKPFEHRGPNGTLLTADRCDLAGGYTLYRPPRLSDTDFATDVAFIFCWHARNILPELNGFMLPPCKKIFKRYKAYSCDTRS